jgi:tetratricopeptide (TPR) repeat protein
MVDNYGYIDDFFKSTPSPEQIKEFEHRIESEPAFAEDVAFYLSAMQAAKGILHEGKKEGFKEIYQQSLPAESVKINRPLKRLWYYVAAAAVILGIVISRLTFFQPATAGKLADKYIQENFISLNVELGGHEDSLQTGIHLFNDGKLPEALELFESILKSDSSNFQALRIAGIVCLKRGQYDKAILYFKDLASLQGYHYNPGMFYEAIALLKRDGPGDKDEAKRLCKQVVAQQLDESDYAQKLLKTL